jgi:hypothetical protein
VGFKLHSRGSWHATGVGCVCVLLAVLLVLSAPHPTQPPAALHRQPPTACHVCVFPLLTTPSFTAQLDDPSAGSVVLQDRGSGLYTVLVVPRVAGSLAVFVSLRGVALSQVC